MSIVIEEGMQGIEEHKTITKEEFFKILDKEPEGLILTVQKVATPFNSKFQDPNNRTNNKKKAMFLDLTFIYNETHYKIGLSHNLGYEVKPNTFNIDKYSLLFKLLCLTTPKLKGLSGVTIDYNKLTSKLTDIKFIGVSELIKSKNNTYSYKLKPVELI